MISFLPFYYIFKTRYNNYKKLLHLFLLYIFPPIIFKIYYDLDYDFSKILAIYLVYELGYIDNDRQVDSRTKQNFINSPNYLNNKIIINILFLFILLFLDFRLNLIIFSLVTALIFIIHNRIKSKYRITTYWSLTVIRVLSPIDISLRDILSNLYLLHASNLSVIKTYNYRISKIKGLSKVKWTLLVGLYLAFIIFSNN